MNKPRLVIVSCLAGIGLLSLTKGGNMVFRRFDIISYSTLSARIPFWRAAIAMIRQRPLAGIGIGAYPLHAYSYSGGDQYISTPDFILRHGPSLSSIAHNEYLQAAAELGLVGLAFYSAALLSFIICGYRLFRNMVTGRRRTLLAAALCAVIAQSIDALANPGWKFMDVSPILWFMMALGMIAIRNRKPGRDTGNHSTKIAKLQKGTVNKQDLVRWVLKLRCDVTDQRLPSDTLVYIEENLH